VLIDICERALRDGDSALAERALTGLAYLSPTSRLWPRMGHLRRLRCSDAILALIDVNAKLLRRPADADDANVYDIPKALRALVHGTDAGDGDRQGEEA